MLKEISNNNTDVMNADASGLAATKAKTGAPKMQEKSETIKAENIDCRAKPKPYKRKRWNYL